MGMSTSVYGVSEPTSEWLKMKAVYDSCESANIEIPDAVLEYFNYDEPNEGHILVDIDDEYIMDAPDVDMSDIIQIDIRGLLEENPNIVAVQFRNSY